MTDSDLIAPEVAKLVHLFSAQANLKFPDLDASVLHEAIARVKERHLEVARAEAVLMVSRAACEEDQELLLKLAQRAHAYLKVYAEADPALGERVEAISLPRLKVKARPASELSGALEGLAPTPKRRGRPPRVHPEAPLFPTEAAAAAL